MDHIKLLSAQNFNWLIWISNSNIKKLGQSGFSNNSDSMREKNLEPYSIIFFHIIQSNKSVAKQ